MVALESSVRSKGERLKGLHLHYGIVSIGSSRVSECIVRLTFDGCLDGSSSREVVVVASVGVEYCAGQDAKLAFLPRVR